MKINILGVGQKMPQWVNAGIVEYQTRLPKDYALNILEIPAEKRAENIATSEILKREAVKIRNAVPKNSLLIGLAVQGTELTSATLAQKLQKFHDDSQDISLIIGGAEGIDQDLLHECRETWSLSRLTFPHPLVRVIIAEQIYRAYTIIVRHPYHK